MAYFLNFTTDVDHYLSFIQKPFCPRFGLIEFLNFDKTHDGWLGTPPDDGRRGDYSPLFGFHTFQSSIFPHFPHFFH